ncbi:hypothetical protein, partial [Dietzia cinnamea]
MFPKLTTTKRGDASPRLVRDLPAGHDDPESVWFIRPEHRDEYQRVTIDPAQLADYAKRAQQLRARREEA